MRCGSRRGYGWGCVGVWVLVALAGCGGADREPVQEVSEPEPAGVEFRREPGTLHIQIGGEPFASYVYYDEEIPRPYFAHVKSPSGIQATRHHPPIAGQDEMDHATFHPGIWMAFGDISGNDYWRLKGKVEHEMFVDGPSGGPGQGSFTVRNYYLKQGGSDRVAAEVARYRIQVTPFGYLLLWDSTFTPVAEEIVFGDQEEMGLGVRVQTPISVNYGGEMVDSEGRKNEAQIWGTQADWVDYRGEVQGQWVGILLMPHPDNFRRSWYHARDYGVIVANPFGRQAMKAGPESRVVVRSGEELRLRYGLLIHSSPTREGIGLQDAFPHFLSVTVEESGSG